MHQFNDIPEYSSWKIIKPITKGWADDQKFFIQNSEGKKFLLRISEGEALIEEAQKYAALSKLEDQQFLSSKLLKSGYCQKGEKTYRLFSWIEGTEILEKIIGLSVNRQYELGFQAGQNLDIIHQIPCPEDQAPWAGYFNQKMDRNIRRYQQSNLKADHAELVLEFMEENRHLLEDRPQTFHHGDYHLGNMLLTTQGELAIIDYNRLGFGDPWEEFNRMSWTAMESKPFANGLIHGYFKEEIPPTFFPLMALYIASNQIGSLTWAQGFGQGELTVARNQYEEVLQWYQNFSQTIPSWYIPKTAYQSGL